MAQKFFQIFKAGHPDGNPGAGFEAICAEWARDQNGRIVVEINAAGEPIREVPVQDCRAAARKITGY